MLLPVQLQPPPSPSSGRNRWHRSSRQDRRAVLKLVMVTPSIRTHRSIAGARSLHVLAGDCSPET
jgi:hypothetical protein